MRSKDLSFQVTQPSSSFLSLEKSASIAAAQDSPSGMSRPPTAGQTPPTAALASEESSHGIAYCTDSIPCLPGVSLHWRREMTVISCTFSFPSQEMTAVLAVYRALGGDRYSRAHFPRETYSPVGIIRFTDLEQPEAQTYPRRDLVIPILNGR